MRNNPQTFARKGLSRSLITWVVSFDPDKLVEENHKQQALSCTVFGLIT
jgi:hypothetical protein